jgi:hypothetical protein
VIFPGACMMSEGREYRRHELDANLMHTSSVKRKKWDGTRIPRITRIGTDDKISVGIRPKTKRRACKACPIPCKLRFQFIRVIRVLFQLRIENMNYLSHFEKRYTLDQSNYLTDDQCNLMDAVKPVAAGEFLWGVREQDRVR